LSYAVLVCPRAQRQIRSLAVRDQNRLRLRILDLGRDPRPADAAVMREVVRGAYRITLGDYRIVYTTHERTVTALVLQVAHRRESYRRSDIDAMDRDSRQWLAD
jgi:mRNA interferase RelE/StbE